MYNINDCFLSYLKLDLASVCADEENHNLMLATLDACWSCVVPCEAARALFLKSEGVYVLLDILEGSPDSLLNIVLGILTDLAEHPHVTKHMTHWSGRQHASVVALLVALWEKECTRLGCPTRFSAVSDTQPFPLQARLLRQSVRLADALAQEEQAFVQSTSGYA
ncbi:hypothetical protein PTSG_00741 [Salpingoeca rosetta]|uniref:Cilia- and flagella-associated protein 69 ARM repeats domain-containing protein n=1 Tax=Salpingoeca rosetta (strain ATCC 50818 / BSB-021) TaxID=946362 RepID=F2TXC3_SALR5|nr:uncharacterized protein PTSG_00741 [Salpingoeca rosetta]EGD76032.1 hypothetical protein PTSG_00741 [Salpingoeca rosetta]|eukprot:XP_004998207.1 hypothetical protein PTSG_00741 [Salpingoeca rosetta]